MATVVFTAQENEWIRNDIDRQLALNQPVNGKMLIVNETNNKVHVPFSPVNIDHGERGAVWDESSRIGTYGVLRRTGMKTPTLAFDLMLSAMGSHGHGNIVGYLNAFDIMAEQGQRTYIHYTSREQGAWLITSYSANVTARDSRQLPTQATVSLGFTRIMNDAAFAGPVNGGSSTLVPPPPPPPAKAGSTPSSTGTSVIYYMKKGDTLWALAQKHYGNPYKWNRIADASGIKNPRTIPIGKKITIPKP